MYFQPEHKSDRKVAKQKDAMSCNWPCISVNIHIFLFLKIVFGLKHEIHHHLGETTSPTCLNSKCDGVRAPLEQALLLHTQ